jgi:hypothetical protein
MQELKGIVSQDKNGQKLLLLPIMSVAKSSNFSADFE